MSALMHAFFLAFDKGFDVRPSLCVLGSILFCSRVSAFCLVGVGWAGPTWPLVGMAVECGIVGEFVVVACVCVLSRGVFWTGCL